MSSFITESNHKRCVKLRGLPFQASPHDIVAFFRDGPSGGLYTYLSVNDVVIDQKMGRPTGYALVFLGNELDAQRAIIEMNKKHMGNRYIDVLPIFLKS
jgi:epithelial splicing regulatory protein 1/2